MAATAIDSIVFRDIFSTEAMRRVFSDENRTQRYLDVEAALARVEASLGIIPREAAEEIQKQPAAIQLRYLQTLVEIGAEKNTTVVFPMPIDIFSSLGRAIDIMSAKKQEG